MVQKTYSPKPSDISSTWHVIDAEGQVLGRLATNIAGLLQGKHKPGYARHMLTGDYIIIVNAEKVATTGRKREQKIYYRHTGYMGHLRETPMWKMLEDHPERVIQKAVKGMLPRNSLGSLMLSRLKIYVGPEHPHQAQVLGGERANLRTPQHPLAERRKKHASRAKAPVEEAAVAAVAEVEEATAIEEVAPVEEQTAEVEAQVVAEEEATPEEPTAEVEEAPLAEAEEQPAEAEEAAVAEVEEQPAEAEEAPIAEVEEQPAEAEEAPATEAEEQPVAAIEEQSVPEASDEPADDAVESDAAEATEEVDGAAEAPAEAEATEETEEEKA